MPVTYSETAAIETLLTAAEDIHLKMLCARSPGPT